MRVRRLLWTAGAFGLALILALAAGLLRDTGRAGDSVADDWRPDDPALLAAAGTPKLVEFFHRE